MISFWFWVLYALLMVVSLVLILLVLVQKGRGGGLSSAFGGGGGGSSAFGAKTGDMLTWATSILFGVFMIVACGLNLVANARQHRLDREASAALVQTQGSQPTQAPAPAQNGK